MASEVGHWASYISQFSPDDPRIAALADSAETFGDAVVRGFDHRSRLTCLLFGEVQSGKTAHAFSVAAKSADLDEGFRTFIYLSTDNVALQEQTFSRSVNQLGATFEIIGESDELRFASLAAGKPAMLVLKKNKRVLEKWLDVLMASGRVVRGPIFVIDDEGDAATPNTKVNRAQVSEINRLVLGLSELGTSGIFLQVTATPQGLFLLSRENQLRPKYIQRFSPGSSYMGGQFFFSRVDTSHNIFIQDDLGESLSGTVPIHVGSLPKFLATFALIASLFRRTGRTVCNGLIHPSVSTKVHHDIALFAKRFYEWFSKEAGTAEREMLLNATVEDLKRTFESVDEIVAASLELQDLGWLEVIEMNSTEHSSKGDNFSDGFHLIIGGNTLGRGVTFPALQATYYSRSSKTPQADTYWQHARMFGYDRDRSCLRVFMPAATFSLFASLEESNRRLVDLILGGEVANLHVLLPTGLKPTRSNILDKRLYSILVGGSNYFPSSPDETNWARGDALLRDVPEGSITDLSKTVAEAYRVGFK